MRQNQDIGRTEIRALTKSVLYYHYGESHTNNATLQVSLDYYRRESAKVYAKFKDGIGTGEVGELLY